MLCVIGNIGKSRQLLEQDPCRWLLKHTKDKARILSYTEWLALSPEHVFPLVHVTDQQQHTQVFDQGGFPWQTVEDLFELLGGADAVLFANTHNNDLLHELWPVFERLWMGVDHQAVTTSTVFPNVSMSRWHISYSRPCCEGGTKCYRQFDELPIEHRLD